LLVRGSAAEARKQTARGTVTAVWYDSEEENFVVQHEFLHLSSYKEDFAVFLERLNEAQNKYPEQHHGHRE
jgi:hypothetical protein